MQIIYISNRTSISDSEAFTWFKPFCEIEELHLFVTFDEAKEFLIKEVIDPLKQKHIDFIITDWAINAQNAMPFLSWLRDSSEAYSANNFKLRSLPILLIEDVNIQLDDVKKEFNAMVRDFPTERSKLESAIKHAIKSWRYTLANELDLIGLNPQTQKAYSKDRNAFISYYKLNVLTRHFVDTKSKSLNYIWAQSDFSVMDNANADFQRRMNKAYTNPSKYLEKEFHFFLKTNSTFLTGESFSPKPIYEPHLYKIGSSYDEPDFINDPYSYTLRLPEVVEIKRQSQRIMRRNGESFLAKVKQSFQQVLRYKAYLESDDPRHQYYIKKYLGKIYPGYEYTLLMGSKGEKEGYTDLIERLKKEFEFEDINLITYEELLDRHVRLCNRLNSFNVFS
ncbi:MAG TPA: hypothetical protein VG367_17700 [Mucilaginibacter sp.]|jgi:hypothetical protein|nr:hypothetical protein [Mucilaginibacter sp.]